MVAVCGRNPVKVESCGDESRREGLGDGEASAGASPAEGPVVSRAGAQTSCFPVARRSLKWPAPAIPPTLLEDVYVSTDSPHAHNRRRPGRRSLASSRDRTQGKADRTTSSLGLSAEEHQTTNSPEARLQRPRGDRPGCWVTWLPCPPI